jgi:DNA methyltransferase 1-associated protein 1
MNDLKSMFVEDKDISNRIEGEITRKTRREGIKADILKIAGGFPSMIPINKDKKDESKQRQKWVWSEFHNPARGDGLRLCHWQRVEDVKKDYEYAQMNKFINIVNIKKEEYDQVSDTLDPTWTWEETEYLWELCKEFDLRFIVIQDRYFFKNQDRSVEELKERYYSVCRKILELRKNYDHPILRSGYSYDQEIKRRACLERIINKNADSQAMESELVDQAQEIKEKMEKIQLLENLEQKMIKQVDDQDIAEGTFEEYIKNKPFTDTSFAYLRSYKLKHPVPIHEKVQKKVDFMLKELGIPERPIPTERVEHAYDTLKNNLIIMISLKKHLEKKEKEKKKLEMSLSEIQSKMNNTKVIAPSHGLVSITDEFNSKGGNSMKIPGLHMKKKRIKSLQFNSSNTNNSSNNTNTNNNTNTHMHIDSTTKKRKHIDDESKTESSAKKKMKKDLL